VNRASRIVCLSFAILAGSSARALAADVPGAQDSTNVVATNPRPEPRVANAGSPHHLESLVPELAEHPYELSPGPREFLHRISISPAYGVFGSDHTFALRAAYNPSSWLGYEAGLGHDPGHSVHAVLHSLSAIVRYPLAGRLQPYGSLGYGMLTVFPGLATNASSVTKNTLVAGGGLEVYIRNDLALRAEAREASVFGQQKGHEGVVVYDYFQGTIGLAFYRSLRP